MARRHRLFASGLLYHVIVRGNQRQETFRSREDYRAYLERLESYRNKHRGGRKWVGSPFASWKDRTSISGFVAEWAKSRLAPVLFMLDIARLLKKLEVPSLPQDIIERVANKFRGGNRWITCLIVCGAINGRGRGCTQPFYMVGLCPTSKRWPSESGKGQGKDTNEVFMKELETIGIGLALSQVEATSSTAWKLTLHWHNSPLSDTTAPKQYFYYF